MNQHDVLDVLACDIAERPAGAPSFEDVAGYVRSVRCEPDTLLVEFDSAAAGAIAALVEAERCCCASIGWDLSLTPAPLLRITAAPAQLELLAQLLRG